MILDAASRIKRKAEFIPGGLGEIFVIYYTPELESNVKGHILVCPPFAEEMNKSRHLITLFAVEAAHAGYGVLVFDLYGTGDSQGGFVDASWDGWLGDVNAALTWLINKGADSITILSVRLGALLTLDAIREYSWKNINKLVFWQPVINGDAYMNQFLRLRMAADFLLEKEKITTNELRDMLVKGENVEVAGYLINPDLFKPIIALKLLDYLPAINVPLFWCEIVSNLDRELTVITRKILENISWRVTPEVLKIKGEQFWVTPEITIVPDLISITTEIITQDS